MELLVPGFAVNLELLKASEWAGILLNTNEVASKLILVKSTFPGLDVPSLLAKYPRVLLRNAEELQRQLAEVAVCWGDGCVGVMGVVSLSLFLFLFLFPSPSPSLSIYMYTLTHTHIHTHTLR